MGAALVQQRLVALLSSFFGGLATAARLRRTVRTARICAGAADERAGHSDGARGPAPQRGVDGCPRSLAPRGDWHRRRGSRGNRGSTARLESDFRPPVPAGGDRPAHYCGGHIGTRHRGHIRGILARAPRLSRGSRWWPFERNDRRRRWSQRVTVRPLSAVGDASALLIDRDERVDAVDRVRHRVAAGPSHFQFRHRRLPAETECARADPTARSGRGRWRPRRAAARRRL